MSELGSILILEYGEAMPAEARSGHGFPVFGSNGEVGRHHKYLIPEPGIIVGRKGSVGKVTWSDEPFWPIDTTYWVNCAPEDRRWIYWILKWLPLTRLDSSTGVPGLNRNDAYALTVDRPRLIERQQIAQILDTLDTAIHQTEAIIAKLKAVKQGLLHDLLTCGIDANGELRPPQAEAPHLYKQSPLGWIPKEWKVDFVSNLTTSSVIGPFGSDLVASDYRATGVPVVFVRDVKPGCLIWKSNVYVSGRKAQALAAHEVVPGDVVATKMGLPPCVAAVYPASMPNGVVTADIVRLRPNLGRILPGWMSVFINAPSVAKQVEQITAGVTRPKVTLRDVRNLRLAVPVLEEQRLLMERVDAIETRLRLEEQSIEKLWAEKTGLMDDLLTGRVRVTALLAEAVQQKRSA
ncbi:MAG: hypothetical protein C0462_01050 [Alcanivorax sp.]|nr:hypothetical protein [Alcanivorax sp.]